MSDCYCFTMGGAKMECSNCIDADLSRAAKAFDEGNFRMFVGHVGDLLGMGSDGIPVTADDDGVAPMREITDMVKDVKFDTPGGRDVNRPQ